MKYKIGVFGSGASKVSTESVQASARQIGEALGTHANEVVLITGGCTGLPYIAARQAAKAGTEVWGYSPVLSIEEQQEFTPNDDLTIYTKLEFVPSDIPLPDNRLVRMKYRNVISTALCDAGIIISGQWGSLNEFTDLIDMQKVVGVLTGTGGVADELPELCKKIVKEGQGKVIFNDDPEKLVKELLNLLGSA